MFEFLPALSFYKAAGYYAGGRKYRNCNHKDYIKFYIKGKKYEPYQEKPKTLPSLYKI